MKNIIIFIAAIGLFFTVSTQAKAGVDPSSVVMKLYSISIYQDGGCTGTPTTISFGAAGTDKDFIADPTLGYTSISNGTYNCLVFEMNDVVTITPAANVGTACTAGTAFDLEVCQTGSSSVDPSTGVTSTCTSGDTDKVFLYISTWSTDTGSTYPGSEAFMPPTSSGDAAHGIKLSSPLVISSNTTGQLMFGAKGKISGDPGNPGSCGMDQPSFGFSTIVYAPPPFGACVTDADCQVWSGNLAMDSAASLGATSTINILHPVCGSFLNGNFCTRECVGNDIMHGICPQVNDGYNFGGLTGTVECTTPTGGDATTSCPSGETCYCTHPSFY